MKTSCLVVTLLIVTGCGSSPSDDRYINYGQVKAERVRIPPCNPFYADELIDWATDLDGEAEHERTAKVAVDADGRVRCSSKESGRSKYSRE